MPLKLVVKEQPDSNLDFRSCEWPTNVSTDAAARMMARKPGVKSSSGTSAFLGTNETNVFQAALGNYYGIAIVKNIASELRIGAPSGHCKFHVHSVQKKEE